MGLFSRPKCPIHNREYSVSSNGFNDYYYCPLCNEKARKEKKEKESLLEEINKIKSRLDKLENRGEYENDNTRRIKGSFNTSQRMDRRQQ